MEHLFNVTNERSVDRTVLGAHFKLLQSFCQFANETLTFSIDNFNTNRFISAKLLTQKEFINEIGSAIQAFQNDTISSFQRNLALIIDITLGDQLMSAYGTNWYFIPDPNGNYPIYTKARSYRKIETIFLSLIEIIVFLLLFEYHQVIAHVLHHNHYTVLINCCSMIIQQYLECLLAVCQ